MILLPSIPRWRWLGLLLPLTVIVAGAMSLWRPAPSQAVSDEAATDAILQEAMRAWHVPGAAVAIVRDDRVIYLKGLGVRALGGADAVTPETLFPLASCTKAFTTAAMAILV